MRTRAAMLLLILTVAVDPPAYGGSLLGGTEITRDTILERMNFFRGLHGLPPLRLDDRLNLAAGDRILDMEEFGYWGHISPTGLTPFVWIRPHGYQYFTAGENLATGFETAELLVQSWMESRGHRANILSSDFVDVGIGVIEGSTEGRAAGKSVVVIFAAETMGPARISKPASTGRRP